MGIEFCGVRVSYKVREGESKNCIRMLRANQIAVLSPMTYTPTSSFSQLASSYCKRANLGSLPGQKTVGLCPL